MHAIQKRIMVLVLWICLALAWPPAFAGQGMPDLGFSLPIPQDKSHQTYLGVSSGERFTLDQVQADILVVEIFSMYCPICQREAPRVNELYRLAQAASGKTIRLIGIGAGNSPFEVDFFRETYGIEFPLFSDGDFHIHKKIGEKGTPFFIGLAPNRDSGKQIFFTHSGDMGNPGDFFDRLLKAWDSQP